MKVTTHPFSSSNTSYIPLICDATYSTDTYSSSFIDFSTLSQQNRQAFLVVLLCSFHESCVAILQLTADTMKVTTHPFSSNYNTSYIPEISDAAYSTDTNPIGFIHFGTMSQQNRQAFVVSPSSSIHKSCNVAIL